jgi:hypothetical protein
MNPLLRLLGAAASNGLLTGQIVFSTAFVGACELPNWIQAPREVNACLELSRVNPLGRFATTKLAGEGPQVVAGDNLGAATRKVSHPATRSPISTGFS